MRGRLAGMGMLLFLTVTGCPFEFGKDGRVDKAAHRDSMEIVRKQCSKEERARFCDGGRQHTAECLRVCGE
jgi:hypothetical protein